MVWFGRFSLWNQDESTANNPNLSLWVLKHLAEKTDLLDYESFLNLKRTTQEKKPVAPDINNPKYKELNPLLSPQERRVIQLARYTKVKQQYDKRNRHYSEIQERSRCITQTFDADLRGYFSFISDHSFSCGKQGIPKSLQEADQFFFTQNHKFYLDSEFRKRHTYITAGSGHGKSVAIQTLIYQDLTADYSKRENDKPSIVLIDPHGDLAKVCARYKINHKSDRLVYIKPSLSKKVIPTANPLSTNINNNDWDALKNASKALSDTFVEIMQGGDGKKAGLSTQMEAILTPCLTSLFKLENSTLVDLMRFMGDEPDEYQALLNHAIRTASNPMHKDILKGDFNKDSYNPTKLSIKTKLRSLLNDDHFYHYLVGNSTFDLEELINKRCFIVFNLSNLGEGGISIGRFIMAQLMIVALNRASIADSQRIPIHLYVDECQNYISDSLKSIVTEARKFKLYGTFAQQFYGQGMNTEMKRAIVGNSGIKITGTNELDTLKKMSSETGADIEELQNMPVGTFHIKQGRAPSIAVKVPKVKASEKMSLEEWRETLKEQIEKYYRPISTRHPKQSNNQGEEVGEKTTPRPHRTLKTSIGSESIDSRHKRAPKGEPLKL